MIRRIDPSTGTIVRIAGTGAMGGRSDRDPFKCELNRPHGIFVDRHGAVLIGESENPRVLELAVVY